MSTSMQINVDDAQVRALLKRAPARIQQELGKLIQGAAIDIQAEMRVAANVGASGDLRRSIRYTYSPTQLMAEIKPEIDYAEALEYGTEPHSVSVAEGSSLRRWAEMKGINPYSIRNAIAAHGTKPHPFIQPTHQKMKPKVENDLASGISRLVEDLNHGRL